MQVSVINQHGFLEVLLIASIAVAVDCNTHLTAGNSMKLREASDTTATSYFRYNSFVSLVHSLIEGLRNCCYPTCFTPYYSSCMCDGDDTIQSVNVNEQLAL